MNIERSEINQILDAKLETFNAQNKGLFDVINTKLDYIKEQTTKTNSRVIKLEEKDVERDIYMASRKLSCPQEERIDQLVVNSIQVKELRGFMIKTVTIAGIFFTILFGLIRVIIESDHLRGIIN